MEEQLRQPEKRVVGTKQVLRALKDGKATHVFLCQDADDYLYRQVQAACEEHRVPMTVLPSMEKLGKLCQIGVKTASAALVK